THCYNPSSGCNDGTLTLPILEYGHLPDNCSITGGYRYRGGRFPQLFGRYFYGDYCSGRIWNGIQSGQTWSSTQLIDTALRITSFGVAPVTLTVARTGAGSGTITSEPNGIGCPVTCAAVYATGATVTLTARADLGSSFGGWSGGGCSGSGTCAVTLGADTTVTATFVLQGFVLSVSTVGPGSVSSNPAGIGCGATCAAAFVPGTTVTLTALTAAGATFSGWSGACAGTTALCT